jgi:predicted outer membrane repeat protein
VSGSIFTGNDTAMSGGAIHALGGGALMIKSSILSDNTATTNGGAISLAGAGTSLVLATSSVSGNAGVQGGGVFADTGAKLTVTGGVFSANSASGDGGGIATIGTAADAVNLTVSGTLFHGNRADNGGAVDTDGDGTVLIKSVRVLSNHAGGFGGGMYLRSSTSVFIQSSLFQHNVASSGDGGGLVIDLNSAAARATIIGTKILDNFASSDSGGLAAFGNVGSVFTLKGSLISGNVAATQAGGMRIAGTTVDLIATVIAGNWAPVGPNIFP